MNIAAMGTRYFDHVGTTAPSASQYRFLHREAITGVHATESRFDGSLLKVLQRLIEEAFMKSMIAKRSVVVAGSRTSVTVEEQFWQALREIAYSQKKTLSDVVTEIKTSEPGNLSSGIRLFVLDCLSTQIRGLSGFRLGSTAGEMFDDERPCA